MKGLKWWMRIVGVFYLFLFVIAVIVNLPPKVTLEGAGIAFDPSNFTHKFLVDTWVMFGLELGVVGAALWVASINPVQNRVLVWTVLGLELVRGIIDDVYMLLRGGYSVPFYVGWIVVHSIIIVTGLLALRSAQQLDAASTPQSDRRLQQAGS